MKDKFHLMVIAVAFVAFVGIGLFANFNGDLVGMAHTHYFDNVAGFCEDFDSSNLDVDEIYVAGTIYTDLAPEIGNFLEDYCSADELKEYVCDDVDGIRIVPSLCEFGCNEKGYCELNPELQTKCVDSDDSYDFAGTVLFLGQEFDDKCSEDGNYLMEYSCIDNNLALEYYDCECSDGACVQTVCEGSENHNIYEKDKIVLIEGETSTEINDVCVAYEFGGNVGTSVKEFTCVDGGVVEEIVDCPEGTICYDGACTEKLCYDSDGQDTTIKGNVTQYSTSLDFKYGADSCTNTEEFDELQAGKNVLEFVCTEGKLDYEVLSCAEGETCLNGLCKVPEGICKDEESSLTEKGKAVIVDEKTELQQLVDSCSDGFDVFEYGQYVADATCEDGLLTYDHVQCPADSYCYDGRCLSSVCNDLDGGNYSLAGYTKFSIDEVGQIQSAFEDTCLLGGEESEMGNELLEWSCENGQLIKEILSCDCVDATCDETMLPAFDEDKDVINCPEGYVLLNGMCVEDLTSKISFCEGNMLNKKVKGDLYRKHMCENSCIEGNTGAYCDYNEECLGNEMSTLTSECVGGLDFLGNQFMVQYEICNEFGELKVGQNDCSNFGGYCSEGSCVKTEGGVVVGFDVSGDYNALSCIPFDYDFFPVTEEFGVECNSTVTCSDEDIQEIVNTCSKAYFEEAESEFFYQQCNLFNTTIC